MSATHYTKHNLMSLAIAGFDAAHWSAGKVLDINDFVLGNLENVENQYAAVQWLKKINLAARDVLDEIADLPKVVMDSIEHPKTPEAKKGFKLEEYTYLKEHRSGWNYVMRIMKDSFNKPDGVKFIDFAERVWGWNLPVSGGFKHVHYEGVDYEVSYDKLKTINGTHVVEIGSTLVEFDKNTDMWKKSSVTGSDLQVDESVPGVIEEDFVTVFHNPPNMPEWFDYENSPNAIIKKPEFVQSLPHCRGIYVFSEYLKKWLLQNIPSYDTYNFPIEVIPHPTEPVPRHYMWSPQKFLQNNDKNIVQIGYWLRHIGGIYKVQVPTHFGKVWLYGGERALTMLEREAEQDQETAEAIMREPVTVGRLNNDSYDALLSNNVVILDLYDSSVNNAVIECIVRTTPMFVRKMDATVECLGEDYPLFFENLSDVEQMMTSVTKIIEGHKYLQELNKKNKYTKETFVKSVKSTEIFKSIC